MTYSLNWDLEKIFPGGSTSEKLATRIKDLHKDVLAYQSLVVAWVPETDRPTFEHLIKLTTRADNLAKGFSETTGFITAIQSADTTDKQAPIILDRLYTEMTAFDTASTQFSKKLTSISDEAWQEFEQTEYAQQPGVFFRLSEERTQGQLLLSEAEEAVISHLTTDGLTAWSAHYDTLVATIEIPFEGQQLSAGQAYNRMMSDPDARVRKELFTLWEAAWAEKAPLFADTLNHLDGFRITTDKLHGITDPLLNPLRYNRMSPATLKTMWEVITQNKQPLIAFLTRKAHLFGKEKMEWQDQDAPVIVGDLTEKRFSFDEAADFIIKNFAKFSPKMAKFAEKAFENNWIEAEDRPGKRPGGYCDSFPESQESRIFMTYGESINEVSTLAHELGHAFHSEVMWDLPQMSQEYAMNVAETASTFAELVVADATLKTATTAAEKINLLDTKLQNATAMFLNIHARFLFETRFYAARQETVLSDEEISVLMVDAQKEAYQDSLASYHPHFWASKLHFFIDDVPFYNFPYTFGYLFSLGIYAYAQTTEENFEDHYIALLRDTASMTTEELAMKHLQVDLTQPDFWQAGIDMVVRNINEFLDLTADFS